MARVSQRRAEVVPLSEFPQDMQERIQKAAQQPSPPPRWIYFGVDSPSPLCAMESRAWYEWHWQRGIKPGANRRTLPPALRESVITRDGMTCQLCHEPVDPEDIHIDHVVPVSRGGTDVLGNLQVTHSLCNMRKGARI